MGSLMLDSSWQLNECGGDGGSIGFPLRGVGCQRCPRGRSPPWDASLPLSPPWVQPEACFSLAQHALLMLTTQHAPANTAAVTSDPLLSPHCYSDETRRGARACVCVCVSVCEREQRRDERGEMRDERGERREEREEKKR